MDNSKMFCFQCEQTAGSICCTSNMGVCGKPYDTANLQDLLVSALIGLATNVFKNEYVPDENRDKLVIKALFATLTNVNFDNDSISLMIDEVHAYGNASDDYDMERVWKAEEDIRSLKSMILFGLKGISAYAYHACVLGYTEPTVNQFLYKALYSISQDLNKDGLLAIVLETGSHNYRVMELLDKANTETFGEPEPVKVSYTIEKGPFIVMSGHDLYALKCLLEQTKDKGVNVYTHGEMLPAHGYPELRKYPQLKGNFGTAWQNQQKEFMGIMGPVIFNTNCIMPPKPEYKDRIYTTEIVAYPGLIHIGGNLDFSPVIEHAIKLGGYKEDMHFTGINGGKYVYTGFGHNAVLSMAGKLIEAIKNKKIRHIFLVGGCDGARPGRNYYTEFVKKAPADTLILTLACGKYRINDLDLGQIEGIPRIIDMGQCNDAYSAIKVALALAQEFDCGVNELPLTLVLTWYEQKAVGILLTLLSLGIKNIILGPTLPAFISPGVLEFLHENYNITQISSPEEDLRKILCS